MDDGNKSKLETIVSRLNPETANEDVKVFIHTSVAMVRELYKRSRAFWTTPEEFGEYQRIVMRLCMSTNELQTTMQYNPMDCQVFLMRLEWALRIHMETYNTLGFPEITINKFLALHVRTAKCLETMKDMWKNVEFVEEVNFFIETYAIMFNHQLRKEAESTVQDMRARRKPP